MIRKGEAMRQIFGEVSDRCQWCIHLKQHSYGRNYYKCELYGNTCCEATDWKKSERGCGMMNQEVDMRQWVPVVDRLKHMTKAEKSPEEVPENQIAFDM